MGLAIYIRVARSGGPVVTADRFLALLARGKGDEAYADAAPGLRARKPAGMLTLEARHLGFTSYAGASWDEIDVTGNEATLEGSVTTRSGDVIPLAIKLVQLENQWRVLSVTLSPPERDEPGGEATPDG
jgi:hypothetical protein